MTRPAAIIPFQPIQLRFFLKRRAISHQLDLPHSSRTHRRVILRALPPTSVPIRQRVRLRKRLQSFLLQGPRIFHRECLLSVPQAPQAAPIRMYRQISRPVNHLLHPRHLSRLLLVVQRLRTRPCQRRCIPMNHRVCLRHQLCLPWNILQSLHFRCFHQ